MINKLLSIITLPILINDCVVLLPIILIGIFCSYVLSNSNSSKTILLYAELLSVIMVFLPYFLTFQSIRFLLGLIIFASGLSIHARISLKLYQYQSKKNVQDLKINNSSWNIFLMELFNTYYFNLSERLIKTSTINFPNLQNLSYICLLATLLDLCTYFIREFIPYNISSKNQILFISLLGGIWVLYSMEFVYCMLVIMFDILGTPLPIEMKHCTPLLSSSVAEFWGIRWNPIVGKLLQDSFYKPLRRLGISRIICMITCFTGSAILHAIPQYISTRNNLDCIMMFLFFFLQGICLSLELLVNHYIRKNIYPKLETSTNNIVVGMVTPFPSSIDLTVVHNIATNKNKNQSNTNTMNNRKSETHQISIACKSVRYQFLIEMLTISFVINTLYYTTEVLSENTYIILLTIGIIQFVSICYCFNWLHNQIKISSNGIRKIGFISYISGSIWTITTVLCLLPLFSIPVLNAVKELYSKSFLIGTIINTLSNIILK